MAYVEFHVNGYRILWSIMSNYIYFPIRLMSAGRSAQTYEKQSVLSSYGSFRKKFGKVRLWHIQNFIETISCFFIFLCDQVWKGGVFINDHFLCIFGHCPCFTIYHMCFLINYFDINFWLRSVGTSAQTFLFKVFLGVVVRSPKIFSRSWSGLY